MNAAPKISGRAECPQEERGSYQNADQIIRTLVFSFAKLAEPSAGEDLPLCAFDLLAAIAAEIWPEEHL